MKKKFVVCVARHEFWDSLRESLPEGEFSWLFFDEVGRAKKFIQKTPNVDLVICHDVVSPILQGDGLKLALYCNRTLRRTLVISDIEIKGMPSFPKKELKGKVGELRSKVLELLNQQPVLARKFAQALVYA